MIRLLFAMSVCFLLCVTGWAQSAVGTWKRTSMLMTEADGKTTDMAPQLSKAMPCTDDIKYTFVADGTFKTDVPESCGAMKKAIESMNKSGRWSTSGNKMKVVMVDKSLPDADYDLSVSGTTMSWLFNYADNPKMPNPTKAKRMVITYKRI